MTERKIKNAKITGASLGYEDHGILTCFLSLNYGGEGQSFGGWALDTPIKIMGMDGQVRTRRDGTAWGMDFIINVLRAVGVPRWEDLVGKTVRVDADYKKVYRIGHILREEWFEPWFDPQEISSRRP